MGEGTETTLPLWPPFFEGVMWRNKILFAGNSRTPADVTVLKIKRYGTGLTQGYMGEGGSG